MESENTSKYTAFDKTSYTRECLYNDERMTSSNTTNTMTVCTYRCVEFVAN